MIQKVKLIILFLFFFTSYACLRSDSSYLTEGSQTGQLGQSFAFENKSSIQNNELENSCYDISISECQKSKFPLYAMLESDDIYLHGVYPYGMILYQNGNGTYFNWPGLTPRRILPELSYFDYNSDGKRELAVILYVYSGTGISLMDLHILNIVQPEYSWDKPIYTDNALICNNIKKWFTKPITYKQSDDRKTVTVNFDNCDYVIRCNDTEQSEAGDIKEISYGDIVKFKFDQSIIKVEIDIGFIHENWVTPNFIATVEATVNFKNNEFSLSEYAFIVDGQYK